jgi:hypothetical protein
MGIALFTPAHASPHSVALRPPVAARSPISGASWWATKAAVAKTPIGGKIVGRVISVIDAALRAPSGVRVAPKRLNLSISS